MYYFRPNGSVLINRIIWFDSGSHRPVSLFRQRHS